MIVTQKARKLVFFASEYCSRRVPVYSGEVEMHIICVYFTTEMLRYFHTFIASPPL